MSQSLNLIVSQHPEIHINRFNELIPGFKGQE